MIRAIPSIAHVSSCSWNLSFCFGNFTVSEAVYIETPTLILTLIIASDIIVKSESSSPWVFGNISIANGSKALVIVYQAVYNDHRGQIITFKVLGIRLSVGINKCPHD